MRARTISFLLALLGLLAAAGTARAYAIQYAVSSLADLQPSDTVQVDVYLDAEPGLQLLSVGVLWETDRLSFDPLASSMPATILYTSTPPLGFASYAEPLRNPWVEWPGDKPEGFSQVNLDFTTPFDLDDPFPPAAGSGTGIWLSSLIFHVDSAGAPPVIDVSLDAAGNILYANDEVVEVDGVWRSTGPVEIASADVPITLVPEPTTALLLVLGVAGAAAARSRRG